MGAGGGGGLPQPRAWPRTWPSASPPRGTRRAALGFAVERVSREGGLRGGGALVLAVATSHPADELTGEADAVVADLTRCCVEVMPTGLVVRV